MISSATLDKLEYSKILNYIVRYCTTETGKMLTVSLKPHEEISEAVAEGELVNQAKEILIKNEFPPIEYITDLNETITLSRIEGTVLDSKKILEILKLALMSRNLKTYLKTSREIAPSLCEFAERLFSDKLFEHYIQKIITDNGEVKDNASQKLNEIRKELRSRREDLIKSVNRMVKSLDEKDIIREDYLTLRDGRIVIPVKAEHKRHIRGFIHSESSTGQTVYIEPEETLELNNEIISLSFAEKREIERLLKEITKRIGVISAELKDSLSVISFIDSVFARAKYSVEIIGSFPSIDNRNDLDIQDARHPLLLKKHGRNETIPLNVKLSGKKVIIITGPNAGGKTVVLKTIGLLALMVQSGLHVPVSPDSNFHFFNNILLDIGDAQSIEDDLSTFSSHLSNIKQIIDDADGESLVLLDEVGTGTDPEEGSALASAVLLRLRDKQATVFATTHHGSLKLIAHDTESFENAAMEFDTKNLQPTYVFKQGIPGSSYAFEVAKRIGLDENFLNLASEYLDEDKHKLENFLVDIESQSHELEEKLKKLEIENSRLNGLSNLYKQNIDKLNKEKNLILKKAKTEADDYIKGINKKIEHVIKELKESNAEKNIIKETKHIVADLREQNKKLVPDDFELQRENYKFSIGNYVALKNTETKGEIVEINAAKNTAVLKIGVLRMRVDLNRLVPAKKEKQKVETGGYGNFSIPPAEMRLDIRGRKPEEAEFEVLKFIDNAHTSGLDRVEILHGKGAGVLKKMVADILKRHDKVKGFYFAPVEFGGEGITIVEIL